MSGEDGTVSGSRSSVVGLLRGWVGALSSAEAEAEVAGAVAGVGLRRAAEPGLELGRELLALPTPTL